MFSARFVVQLALLSTLAIGLAGCGLFQKEKPPFTAPTANLAMVHYAGSVLSGPQARAIGDADLKDPWLVKIDLVAAINLPTTDFSRISNQAKLIIAARSGVPMAASVEIGSNSTMRIVTPEFDRHSVLGDPKTFADITSRSGAVVPGTAAQIDLSSELSANTTGRRSITIRVGRTSAPREYELAIISNDLVVAASDNADEKSAAPIYVPREETIYLTRKLELNQERLLLVIPKRFAGSDANGIVVDLSIQASPDEQQMLAAAEVLKKDIATSSMLLKTRLENLTAGSAEEIALTTALSALAQAGDSPRGALSYLASESGARLSSAIVLVADNAQLQLLAKSVVERSQQLQKRDKPSVAWLLDRTTIATLAALANDTNHPLSQSVYGALSTYAGDVGRQLDVLQSIAAQSASPAEMQVRIVGEQMILLEDNSPSARVRAYDWLLTHGLAPAGYDPLAPIKQRREALQKASTTDQAVQK